MLNLSDKELDRLAREAASEYEPGKLTGSGSWNKLAWRLDKELGTPRPNLLRSIRRMSFYYAPAILMLIGVSYLLIRQNRTHPRSGSPPHGGPPFYRFRTADRRYNFSF